MDFLREIRSTAGKTRTHGLSDATIERFLAKDAKLATAITKAHKNWLTKAIDNHMDEVKFIESLQEGFCVFYPENTRNPYVTSAAKGPWIVTAHGAVIHDNGGYGMLGFGHSPEFIIEAMSEDVVMANIMTASIPHQKFIKAMRKEIGHNRSGGCPFKSFVMMNSGSEGNSVAARIIDIYTGRVAGQRQVKGISLRGAFHGRTYKPALWSDSCSGAYKKVNAYTVLKGKEGYTEIVPPNDVAALRAMFKKAEEHDWYIESVFMESVMGEGNPGVAITPEFYKAARELTTKHDSFLLVDNIQAGLRCTGNLSIVDYKGFENLPCPDFEVYSKAINGGQYPVSCVALSKKAAEAYRHGIYGNTMTGNPRACLVATAVLNAITPRIRSNIVDIGQYVLEKYRALQKEMPSAITNVQGTGLLYSVQLNKEIFEVVAFDGVEDILRQQGLGVIHGGDNALRFTPHFHITKDEIDLQVDMVRNYLMRVPYDRIGNIQSRTRKRVRSEERAHDEVDPTVCKKIKVTGHLFDRNVINQLLNLVEEHHGTASLEEVKLGENKDHLTSAEFKLNCPKGIDNLCVKISDLSKVMGCEYTMGI